MDVEATIHALTILTDIQRESMCDRYPQDERDKIMSRILSNARAHLYRSLNHYLTGGPNEVSRMDLQDRSAV